MKSAGILVGKCEFINPWGWLELYFTPKRFLFKRNRLDYQPLFRKGTRASRPDSSKTSGVRSSAHIVKFFNFLSDSIYHPMNFCERKIRFG